MFCKIILFFYSMAAILDVFKDSTGNYGSPTLIYLTNLFVMDKSVFLYTNLRIEKCVSYASTLARETQ